MGKLRGMESEASQAILDGIDINAFREIVMNKMVADGKATPVRSSDMTIGMDNKEIREYSILRAIEASITGDWSKAELEKRCSDACAKKYKKDVRSFMIPMEIAQRRLNAGSQAQQVMRDMTVGTPADGGNLVSTELLSGSLIDQLQNLMLLKQMGIQVLDGLVGNITIPRVTGGATAYWLGENGKPTESSATIDQVGMVPKTVAAFTQLSRAFIQQSSIGAEAFAQYQLALALALEIDSKGIAGDGTNNTPIGIMNTTGVGAVVMGANGDVISWTKIVEMWKTPTKANARQGNLGWLTNSNVIADGMTTEKFANSGKELIPGEFDQNGFTKIMGYKAGVSEQVPSNLTKGSSSGVCSSMIFGDFSQLIMGLWGGLDILVDPYTEGESGAVKIIAHQSVNFVVAQPKGFAVCKDITTN